MTKRRNKTRKRRSLEVFILCISTAMVLVLLGMVALTVFTNRNLSAYVKENLTITMTLNPELTNEECSAICMKIDGLRYINNINFVSKEEALKEGTKELGANPMEFAGVNPFSAEIEIQLRETYANNDSVRWIAKELKQIKGVRSVDYRQELIDSVNKVLGKVSLVLLIIAGLLTIVSFSLINNTVRLSVYSRRFTIHTMKLVGASWGFIRKPFLRRAVLVGLISAMIAICVLMTGMYFLYSYEPDIEIVLNGNVLLLTSAIMIVFGVLITCICTWLSVNKFLKMKAGDLHKI